jgi:hypothetical protein
LTRSIGNIRIGRAILRNNLLLLVGVLTAFGVPAHAADFRVRIVHDPNGVAVKACAAALQAKIDVLAPTPVAVQIKPAANDDINETSDQFDLKIELNTGAYERDIGDLTYVFQSPEHFRAFLDSDIYRRLIAGGDSLVRDVAYGGFYQLFSMRTAFTEPSHFYDQWMGGSWLAQLYLPFHSNTTIHAMLSPSKGAAILADVADARAGRRGIDAIEAPLIEESSYGLKSVARFVNLTYTAVQPVYYETGFQWSDLPIALTAKLKAWFHAAALECSARNLEKEKEVINDLRARGLSIVPVNRDAFVEAGYLFALKSARGWSAQELDQIVRLAPSRAGIRLPLALVASLPPAARARLKEADAEFNKRSSDKAVQDLGARLLDVWKAERTTLVERLRGLTVPWPPVGFDRIPRPEVRRPDVVAALLVDQNARLRLAPVCDDNRSRCRPDLPNLSSVNNAHVALARAYWGMDDVAGLDRVLADAMGSLEQVNRRGESHLDQRLRGLGLIAVAAARPGARSIAEALIRMARNMTSDPNAAAVELACEALAKIQLLSEAVHIYAQIGPREQASAVLSEALGLMEDTTINEQMAFIAGLRLSRAGWDAGESRIAWLLYLRAMQNAPGPTYLIHMPGVDDTLSHDLSNTDRERFADTRRTVYPQVLAAMEEAADRFRAIGAGRRPDASELSWSVILPDTVNLALEFGDFKAAERLVATMRQYEVAAKSKDERKDIAESRSLAENELARNYKSRGDLASARAIDSGKALLRLAGTSIPSTPFAETVRAGQWDRAEQLVVGAEKWAAVQFPLSVSDAPRVANISAAQRAANDKQFEGASRDALVAAAAQAGNLALVRRLTQTAVTVPGQIAYTTAAIAALVAEKK